MSQPMKYEVQNEEIENLLKVIGRALKESMPDGWLFSLHIYSAGEGASMFYISSADRRSYVQAMREFIQKFGEN